MVTELCYVGAGIGNQPVTRVLTVLTLIQHGARSARSVFSNHQHEISFTAASAQPSTASAQHSSTHHSSAQRAFAFLSGALRRHIVAGEFHYVGKEASTRWAGGPDLSMMTEAGVLEPTDDTFREYERVVDAKY